MVVSLNMLNDVTVQRTTGFRTVLAMMEFILIVCRGDIQKIIETKTKLTRLEEWYLYFEILYGKSIVRWVDAVEKYQVSDRTLRRVFDDKLRLVLNARRSWPLFASIDKDKTY